MSHTITITINLTEEQINTIKTLVNTEVEVIDQEALGYDLPNLTEEEKKSWTDRRDHLVSILTVFDN